AGVLALLRQSPPARDGSRHGDRPHDPAAGRADRRDEPARDAGAPGSHRADAGRGRAHSARDRARHARREGSLRSCDRMRLRAEDRRRHVRGGREQRTGDRGLPGHESGRMSAEPERRPILEMRNVSTHYGLVSVLRNVDVQIYEGEMVCLLGGNASGKTTTLKTILGYVTPSEGEVLLDGDVVSGMPTIEVVRRGVSM